MSATPSVKDLNVVIDDIDSDKGKQITRKANEVRTKHWYDGFVKLFFWYPFDLPKKEKWLLFKLDVILLLYVCATYFTKALDSNNLVKAYNAHMKTDINMTGDDLAYAKSIYSAGYIVSMCTTTLFVTRPWARVLLPVFECVWGVLTFCQASVKNPSQLFALRFLVGLAEGPVFPSIAYCIGSWYKRDEVFRRMNVFTASSLLGGMFSGFFQSAAFNNLSGKGGLAGWKWGFIIDGIFTVPIALFGFFLYPGSLDQSGKVWWLTEEEKELAHARMKESGVEKSKKYTIDTFKSIFKSWHIHYFTAFWVLLWVVALPDGLAFDLWLASRDDIYTMDQIQNYPAIQAGVCIIVQFIFTGLCDTYSPYIFLTIVQLLYIISYSSLIAWDIPIGYRWFCYIIVSLDNSLQAMISSLTARSLRRNAEERAFVFSYSGAVSQAMNIWTNIVFFPTSEAPEFRKGFIASLVGAILLLFLPIINYYGDKYDDKIYADADFAASEADSTAEITNIESQSSESDSQSEKDAKVVYTERRNSSPVD